MFECVVKTSGGGEDQLTLRASEDGAQFLVVEEESGGKGSGGNSTGSF